MLRLVGTVANRRVRNFEPSKTKCTAYVAATITRPATARLRRFVLDSGRYRPRIIPAQRKASHGSSGWVPLTNVSNTNRRGERYCPGAYQPANSHAVL